MSFKAVGIELTRQGLREHAQGLDLSWANSVTLHHTATPSLAQRPNGFSRQHIVNIADFYKNKLGWSSGPHLFIDDSERPFKAMTPLSHRGVHARSYNYYSIGLEVLGNYDHEDANSGRGFLCWQNAARAVSIILKQLGLMPDKRSILFHRDDPKTNKTCPGRNISKDAFLELVRRADDQGSTIADTPGSDNEEIFQALDWQLDQIHKEDPRDDDEKFDQSARLKNIKFLFEKLANL